MPGTRLPDLVDTPEEAERAAGAMLRTLVAAAEAAGLDRPCAVVLDDGHPDGGGDRTLPGLVVVDRGHLRRFADEVSAQGRPPRDPPAETGVRVDLVPHADDATLRSWLPLRRAEPTIQGVPDDEVLRALGHLTVVRRLLLARLLDHDWSPVWAAPVLPWLEIGHARRADSSYERQPVDPWTELRQLAPSGLFATLRATWAPGEPEDAPEWADGHGPEADAAAEADDADDVDTEAEPTSEPGAGSRLSAGAPDGRRRSGSADGRGLHASGAASGAVVEWRPVSRRWLGHRSEPLLRERFWGCDLPLADDVAARATWWGDAGYDADGRAVGWRPRSRPAPGRTADPPGNEEVVTWDGGVRVLRMADGAELRTTFDDAGHPVRTDYRGVLHSEPGAETYEYDDAGRLIAIEEYPGLHWTVEGRMLERSGGRLAVEHDADGPVRITEPGWGVRWERPTRPWPAVLAEHADRLTADCLRTARDACADDEVDPATEVFALSLTYVEDGGLHITLEAGPQERRADPSPDDTLDDVDVRFFYLGDDPPLEFVEVDSDDDEDDRALREACMQQTDDPQRVVLGAVATRLSEADWSGILTPTSDFVVFVAEHDEDVPPKLDSIRRHNAPERARAWEAAWHRARAACGP